MITLEQYFRAIKTIQTGEECLRLQSIDPTPIAVEYGRLLQPEVSFSRESYDNLFNSDHTAKLEVLSPLTQKVLGDADSAGLDLQKLSYSISIFCGYAFPSKPWDWHTDGRLGASQASQEILRESSIYQMVHSDVFPTAHIPQESIYKKCPGNYDPALFYVGVADCLKKAGKAKFDWEEAQEGFTDHIYEKDRHRQLVRLVRQTSKELIKHCIIPSSSPNAVHFNFATPHALTCQYATEQSRGNACMRHRTILTITLAQ